MNFQRIEKIATHILILITVGAFAIKPAIEISTTPLGGGMVDKLLNASSYLILFSLIAYYWKGFLYVSSKNLLQILL